MNLTVDGLVTAIQSARSLEKLQTELRDAMIASLMQPANPELTGTPNPIELSSSAVRAQGVFPGS